MSAVEFAVVTVPTAPSLKTTVSLAAVGSKPKPVDRERGRVGGQTGGAGWSPPASTVATWTAVPLLTLVGRDHGGQAAGGRWLGARTSR